MDTPDTLNHLLDEAQGHAPEYRGGLSNHGPMALGALQRLGADDARLRDFARRYTARLTPLADTAPPPDGPALGEITHFGAWRSRLRAEIAAHGADAVLRAQLPRLMAGCGAAAFHGLIRTAYAVEARHDGELAAGLAYWAARHLPLGDAPAPGDRPFEAWIAAVESAVEPPSPNDGLIFEQMRRVAALPAFGAALAGLRRDDQTLATASRVAAERYLRTRDFTVLHLVTSAHALRVLMPWCDDADAALAHYATAFAAAWVASAASARAAPPTFDDTLDWPAIVERAIASDNDHVIKLVHTCREEQAHRGDDRYRRVAALAVSG